MFAAADAIVAAVPLASPGLPFAALVHALYDLTPVEAITAEALLEGRSVREIAALRGIGVETVRTYVRNILAKTGTARQAELVARFSSLKATAPKVAAPE